LSQIPGPSTIGDRQSIDELMSGKMIVKISNVKFSGGFMDFLSLTWLSKYFGALK
jgi:hypothetical protein